MKKIAKVFVLDPGMKKCIGHHHAWNTILQRELAQYDIPCEFFFSSKIISSALAQYENASPFFTYNAHRYEPETSDADAARAFFIHAGYCFRDLVQLTERVTSDTLVFGHTITASSMLGIALWYASLPENRRPYVALNVHFLWESATEHTLSDFTLAVENFRNDPRVRLFAVPDSIVKLLYRSTGFQAEPLPMPFYSGTAASEPAIDRGTLVFGVAGACVSIKNLTIFPAAIERYLEGGGKGNFLIQLAPLDERLNHVCEELAMLAKRYPDRCVFIHAPLEEQAFRELIQKFSVALAPFDPKAYHEYRPSQFFQEVTSLGIPSIICAGGFLQEEAERWQNGSIVIPSATPKNLCKAMFAAERSIDCVRNKAGMAGKSYSEFNNIENFMQTILSVENSQVSAVPTFYIVTPSKNSEKDIEKTISSIVSQCGNFFIRYHVQDGGSTDSTIQILKKWEKRLASGDYDLISCNGVTFSWSSEPDISMYQGINRGFTTLKVPNNGIMAWLNTDDIYLPRVFECVAKSFNDVPEMMWLGGGILHYALGALIQYDRLQPYPPELVRAHCCDNYNWRRLHQEGMFWKGSLWHKAGPLDERLRCAGDYDLWPRFARFADYVHFPAPFSLYTSRPDQLAKMEAENGISLYELESEGIVPSEQRENTIRRFWRKRLLPPKGPSLLVTTKKIFLKQKTAWPAWGQEYISFYKKRMIYCWHRLFRIPPALANIPFLHRIINLLSIKRYFPAAKKGTNWVALTKYLLTADSRYCTLPYWDADYYTKLQWGSRGKDVILYQVLAGRRYYASAHPAMCSPLYALKNYTRDPLLTVRSDEDSCPLVFGDGQEHEGKVLSKPANVEGIPVFTVLKDFLLGEQEKALASWHKQGLIPVVLNDASRTPWFAQSFPIKWLPPADDEENTLASIFKRILLYAKEHGSTSIGMAEPFLFCGNIDKEALAGAAQGGFVFSRRAEVGSESSVIQVWDTRYSAFFCEPEALAGSPEISLTFSDLFETPFLPMWSLLRKINLLACAPLGIHKKTSPRFRKPFAVSANRDIYNCLTPMILNDSRSPQQLITVLREKEERILNILNNPEFKPYYSLYMYLLYYIVNSSSRAGF